MMALAHLGPRVRVHDRLVVAIPARHVQQDKWLDRAKEQGWSANKLVAAIRQQAATHNQLRH
jgi:hypothetical protein